MKKGKKLSVGARWLLMLLKDKQEEKGENFEMTLVELEELTGVSRPTVIGYKRELIEVGLLNEVTQYATNGGRLPNKFTVKEV